MARDAACLAVCRGGLRGAGRDRHSAAVAADDNSKETEGDVPALYADERKLKQILANLLSNAVKFTESGGRVTLGISCSSENGHMFEVSDTGIGMAPEDIPKALSLFGQVDGQLNRKHEGTGLGLPLTKALTEPSAA